MHELRQWKCINRCCVNFFFVFVACILFFYYTDLLLVFVLLLFFVFVFPLLLLLVLRFRVKSKIKDGIYLALIYLPWNPLCAPTPLPRRNKRSPLSQLTGRPLNATTGSLCFKWHLTALVRTCRARAAIIYSFDVFPLIHFCAKENRCQGRSNNKHYTVLVDTTHTFARSCTQRFNLKQWGVGNSDNHAVCRHVNYEGSGWSGYLVNS